MENTFGIQVSFNRHSENRALGRHRSVRAKTVEQLSIMDWYRILRVYRHLTTFQAIRFALWLAR
jgi:hypothetical protein